MVRAMTQAHEPCWHRKELNADRTHGAYGAGRAVYTASLPVVICCECGTTLVHFPEDSGADLVERHDAALAGARSAPLA